MGAAIDLTGQKFGRWTVLNRTEGRRQNWDCRCECGREKSVYGADLRVGKSLSCGCLRGEGVAQRNRDSAKHGMFGTPEYKTWSSMIQRCTNSSASAWPNYGGRGIGICISWRESFEEFYADMGPRPKGTTLGRIDNEGDYEPGNCRWETFKEQASNRRSSRLITYNDETKTLQQWADWAGLSIHTLSKRLGKYGWDFDRAITAPLRSYNLERQ